MLVSHIFSIFLLIHFFITFDSIDHFSLLETVFIFSEMLVLVPSLISYLFSLSFLSYLFLVFLNNYIFDLFCSYSLNSIPFLWLYHWWFLKLSNLSPIPFIPSINMYYSEPADTDRVHTLSEFTVYWKYREVNKLWSYLGSMKMGYKILQKHIKSPYLPCMLRHSGRQGVTQRGGRKKQWPL